MRRRRDLTTVALAHVVAAVVLAGCASATDAKAPVTSSGLQIVAAGEWDGWWTDVVITGDPVCRQVTIPSDVLFTPDSDVPGPRLHAAVASAVDAARAVKGPVQVLGYTDDQGPENIPLSQRRARNVAAALVSNGLEATRLRVRGEGESSPIASNSTESGRARNRRVEIRIGACPATATTP